MNANGEYLVYKEKMQNIADVKYAAAVLQWDQETYLPPKGAAGRARQLATLSETAHVMSTDESLGALLNSLAGAGGLSAIQKKNVALTLEEYNKQKKFTPAFVREMSEAVSAAFYAWIDARKQNDFKVFQPKLERIVALKRQETGILGYEGHCYNSLLNEYEKGATVQMLDEVFDKIATPLKDLMVQTQRTTPDDGFLHLFYDRRQQWEWGMYLVKELGFDLEAGRQDISEHPFTTNFSAKDVRITTRIDEHDFANMTWSCIHETGHALYEQGLPDEEYGLPSGEFASLGIHESQSRLWENCVGRSKTFWKHYLPKLQQYFPEQLSPISLDQFFKAINKVSPSLIRTEADEISYHFHVRIRYTIEKELLENTLKVGDIPGRWNDLYKQDLDITVPDDKQGCLQDVHWSHGSFGYFPTYSLGSFYAAQFYNKAEKDIPNLEELIAGGNTAPLLDWLRQNIHKHGKTFNSEELCELVTGKKLDTGEFMAYVKKKHALV
ncbi:carboxypeptidase M32 [Danxiaibacter flavus]|uniref:Metal-dependent carboxypeptidase n=1 Tax=Danxiaibacter flavus TaxID=3049108 RepID=A0ABV3ZHH2_9BACT|nr:carboxypeptidase M32 [Chitinophagaceae bacterium DXS]